MNVNKVLHRVAAVGISGVMAAGMLFASSPPVQAASKSDISADTSNVYFSSAVPSASPGCIILNCLGYFVSFENKDNQSLGTVFVHDSTQTGRAYYNGYNRTTGKPLVSPDGLKETEIRIPIQDILTRFTAEYGQVRANVIKEIIEKRINGSCSVNSLMCVAQLAGGSAKVQDGWNQSLVTGNTTFPEIAYTQARLRSASVNTKDLLGDLSVLDKCYRYKDAMAQNDMLKCLEVNSAVNLTNGRAIVAVTNGCDGFAKQFGNLNSDSTFSGFGSLRQTIGDSYFGINVNFIGKIVKTMPGKVGKVSYTDQDLATATAHKEPADSVLGTDNHDEIFTAVLGVGLFAFLAGAAFFAGIMAKKNKDDDDK